MSDLPDIPSPCISVCQLNPATGLCLGCYRTVEEISRWATASNEDRYTMLQELKARRRAAGQTSAADSRQRRRGRGRT